MLYGSYEFHSEFTGKAILPPYKGSTLRGAFGVALKKALCALKLQQCGSCPLARRCIYCQVFENSVESGSADAGNAPHPFVIEPPLDDRVYYEASDSLDFRLLLFGAANESLNYFIYAFQQMGRLGLGRIVDGKRGIFELKTVMRGRDVVFDSVLGTISPPKTEELDLSPVAGSGSPRDRVRIIFQTPLRLKFKNNLLDDLPFHVLIRSVLRRISSLNNSFGDGEPRLDYRGLVERAGKVRQLTSSLRWLDWARYSNRQETRMQMGGLVGEAVYEGAVAEYIPLLNYCELTHIGKATTFGLGKIQVQ